MPKSLCEGTLLLEAGDKGMCSILMVSLYDSIELATARAFPLEQ